MCSRYPFMPEECPEILKIAEAVERQSGIWISGEICPKAQAPVLLSGRQGIRAELQTWGYSLSKTLVINARAETAGEKNLFRESLASMRCAVPSTGFYEWDAERRKYRFNLPGEPVLYMAGLYRIEQGRPCFCILTTAANDSLKAVHDRMPLVLKREAVRSWLEQPGEAGAILRRTPPRFVKTPMDAQLSLW